MRKTAAPPAPGETEIARRLYAGRYADILADTIDSRAAGCAPEDVAFVVGALCFVGRAEEAELFLESHRRGKQPAIRTLAAGGFFLTVAHARSGDFMRARRTLTRAHRETAERRDPWSRAFLFQAIACCHYFTAKYTRAARAAFNAQASAIEAHFAYIQMLATDMRAHVLAQRGDLDEGLRLLEQARDHARHLGFDVNVRVIEASIALARARVNHPVDAVAVIEQLLEATDIQDGYSRRLLSPISRAATRCSGADRTRGAPSTRPRASARVTRARRRRWRARAPRWRACSAAGRRRCRISPKRDAWPRASTIRHSRPRSPGSSSAAPTFLDDVGRRAAAIGVLEALVTEHNLYRARSWLFQYDVTSSAAEADELARTLRPVVATARLGVESRAATQAILRCGLWGLVAEASGLPPARRIHLFDDAEVLEAEGDVRRLSGLPPRGRSVLTALSRRPLSKEALLAAVWGVPSYRPERHDSVVKTTISRLRAALGRGHMWVETDRGRLRAGRGHHRAGRTTTISRASRCRWRRSRSCRSVAAGKAGAAEEARAVRWARLAQEIVQSGERSVGELRDRGSRVAAHGEPRSVGDAPAGSGGSRRRRPRHPVSREAEPAGDAATRRRCHAGGEEPMSRRSR